MKNSVKEIKNELASTGNRADQMQERISCIQDRNLEMTQREDEKHLSIKKLGNSTRTI